MIKAGQKLSVMIADYCEVTIVRPSGETEVKRHPTIKAMSAPLLAKCNAAMAAAKLGKIVSYSNVQKESFVTITAADEATDSTARIERAMRAGE